MPENVMFYYVRIECPKDFGDFLKKLKKDVNDIKKATNSGAQIPYMVVDFLGEFGACDSSQVRHVAAILKVNRNFFRQKILFLSDSLSGFGMCRMLASYLEANEGFQAQLFEDRETMEEAIIKAENACSA